MKRITTYLMIFCLIFLLAGCENGGQEKIRKPKGKKVSDKADRRPGYIYGKVKKTMEGGGYTYMLLEFDGKNTWVAVPRTPVKNGDEVMLYPGQVMKDFHSKSLDKTFDSIIFSQGPVTPPSSMAHGTEASEMAIQAHSSTNRMKKKDVRVKHASGAGAITIATAYEKAKELNGKEVVLRAVVERVLKNILGKNWIHCQDGTGTEAGKNYDITVTTKASPEVGSTVLIKGTLVKDKNIGAGYFYPVIIENAKVTVLKK